MSYEFFQSGLDENLNSIIEQERYKNGLKGNLIEKSKKFLSSFLNFSC